MNTRNNVRLDTLAIVGNGFDLAHNYKTDYKTFAEKVIHPSLKKFKDLCEREQDITTWFYFEESIKVLTDSIFQKNLTGNCDFDKIQLEGKNLKSIFQDIHNLLIHYLKNETSTNQLIIKKSIKEIIGSNTIAFNFNYTSTIESYTENVIYIHGSLKEDDIILGYDYRDEACFADYNDVYWSKRICRENLAFRRFLKNRQNGIVLSKHKALIECLEIYQTYANSGRGIDDEVGKDVLDFEEAKAIINTIKENDYPNIFYEEIKTIVVLGHGIEADKVYLQGLLQKCPNIEKVIIFRYDKESDEAFNKKARFLSLTVI